MRLNKWLAQAGIAARRKCDRLIEEGRVQVNGRVVCKMGVKVDPETDVIVFDGSRAKAPPSFVYVLLNKPAGVLVSRKDPQGRPTVFDLVQLKKRLFSVGRLDLDTEGVLLLTNDGALCRRLSHPSFKVEKVYEALVEGIPDRKALNALREGVMLKGEASKPKGKRQKAKGEVEKHAKACLTAPAKVKLKRIVDRSALLELTLHEGRKRQVKRMCEAVGHRVTRLVRTRFAELSAKGLPPGRWRFLTALEITRLQSLDKR
ncbi:MAG: pseudouridine synthase [Candidatus Latescibacterota bacterium]|nr:MAG: pseudouridine synthase [Candidatus Latescibacterota bacterium]